MCTLLALLTPALDGVNFPYLALKGPALKGPALKGTALKGPALKGPALEGPALKGPKTQDFPPSRAFFFQLLFFGPFTYYVIREGGRGRGVEMLIYASMLESGIHSIGSEIRQIPTLYL